MTSPLLALFARSLREDARGKLTYFARAGLIVVILLFLFFTQVEMGWSNAPGLQFFTAVVNINACFILLAGLSYFASAIAEEKEEMTLGLLRMTNLNPLSILLGKSTSRVLGALLLLAAQFPFTLLAVSLGGVSVGQIVACYCALAAFIVGMSNLALLCSVICRRTGGAAVLAVLLLVAVFVVVPMLNLLVSFGLSSGAIVQEALWVRGLHRLARGIERAVPFARLEEILRTGFDGGPWCWQVASNLAVGAVCFLLAWAVFEVFCHEQPETGPARGLLARRVSLFRSTGAGRVWPLALAWKDFHFLAGGKVALAVKFVLYPLPFFAMRLKSARWGGADDWDDIGMAMFGWMLAVLAAELSFAAARVFRIERQEKTLPTLAMLPRGMAGIAYEKVLGCLPALAPAAFWMVVGALMSPGDLRLGDGLAFVVLYGVAQAALFLHLVALLSLHIRRGALAVGIGLHFITQALFLTLLLHGSRGDAEAGLMPGALLVGFATFVLHGAIILRLEAVAAEE